MSTRNWSDAGTKRLDFGGGSAGRMEWLFGGALVLIIALALGLMIYSWVRDKNPPGNTNPEMHLQCLNPACKNLVVKKFQDFSPEDQSFLTMPPMPAMQGMQPPRVKCEKCGQAMGKMKECPGCKEFYLDPREINYSAMEDKCPKCGLDVMKYWQDKAAAAAANSK